MVPEVVPEVVPGNVVPEVVPGDGARKKRCGARKWCPEKSDDFLLLVYTQTMWCPKMVPGNVVPENVLGHRVGAPCGPFVWGTVSGAARTSVSGLRMSQSLYLLGRSEDSNKGAVVSLRSFMMS